MKKRCGRCGAEKEAYKFHRRASMPDGRDYYCRACRIKLQRESRVGRMRDTPWGPDDPEQIARESEANRLEREEEERRDREIAALLHAQRLEVAGV